MDCTERGIGIASISLCKSKVTTCYLATLLHALSRKGKELRGWPTLESRMVWRINSDPLHSRFGHMHKVALRSDP
jgi:hypothetical protein